MMTLYRKEIRAIVIPDHYAGASGNPHNLFPDAPNHGWVAINNDAHHRVVTAGFRKEFNQKCNAAFESLQIEERFLPVGDFDVDLDKEIKKYGNEAV